MNQDVINGKWTEIKGEIRKMWGDVTGDELEQSKGNLTSIAGIIQQRYGEKKEDVSGKLDQIISRFAEKKEDLKRDVSQMAETIKNDLKKNNV